MIQIRVPATSANLGPGFDCLGLALSLYNFITIEKGSFSIALAGPYSSGIPTDETNLVWQSMLRLWETVDFPIPAVKISLENNIPPARGLGSSSAAIVGGLVAANAFANFPLSQHDLLQLAAGLEGHPDNITPAFLGGVTLAVPTTSLVLPRQLVASPKLKAIAIVPAVVLNTKTSRNVLSPLVSRQDAVFNIAHTALLVEAFLKEDYTHLAEAAQDRMHQEQRSTLIPGLSEVLKRATEAGAYCAFLSGSGPSLLALTAPGTERQIADALIKTLSGLGTSAQALLLDFDRTGVQLLQAE